MTDKLGSEDQIREIRIKKIEDLKKKDINPFASLLKRTHSINEVNSTKEKLLSTNQEITIVGRIRSFRGHGKSSFFHLDDGTETMQIYAKKDLLDEESQYLIFDGILDLGDFVETTGALFTTKTGETTLKATKIKLLTKSIRPIPSEWYGLKDIETRYRKRYLDFLANPKSKDGIILRSKILHLIRSFLVNKGFLEIENPMLEASASGAMAKPFNTHINAYDMDLYLRICAGELWQKRSLVGGFEKIFDLGKSFRNEGVDFEHNPEFTMLEFYWAYGSLFDNINLHQELFAEIVKLIGTDTITYREHTINLKPPYPIMTFREVVKKHSGIDIEEYKTLEEVRNLLTKKNIPFELFEDKGKLLDIFYKHTTRPFLIDPVFITEYPAELKPLAKKVPGNENYVDIFQLLIAGMEVSNSYNELNDPIDQRKRFEDQSKNAKSGDEEAMAIDEDYIEALEYGMPPATGTGIGIDRLIALISNASHLREIIAYPIMKPELTKTKQTKITSANVLDQKTILENNNSKGKTPHLKSINNQKVNPISREKAWEILTSMTTNKSLLKHALGVEACMRFYAKKLNQDEDLWGITGLLHDADYDKYPQEHPSRIVSILDQMNVDPQIPQAIACHGTIFGIPQESLLDKYLFAVDELSGFVTAVTLVRPSKQIADVKVKFVKKKLKNKGFAKGVSRNDIQIGIEQLGIDESEHIQNIIDAMTGIAKELELA